MSSQSDSTRSAAPLDLSKWRALPNWLIIIGGLGCIIGACTDTKQFGYSWLLAYMFFLSLCLGGLGLTILHHLFDAAWSVPIRRVTEQMGFMLRYMCVLWIPIGVIAVTQSGMYEWIQLVLHGTPDLATKAKFPLFTIKGFYLSAAFTLGVFWWLPAQLRKWSLKQDETGSVHCTRMMRKYAAVGVFLFAFSLTLAAIMWMKALQHEWFSTMYGVYYFAGSMWTTLATVYVLVRLLENQGPLKGYVQDRTYYYLGTILFAFTVFYAYVTFAQYFIIWNANMPEETFWYVMREKGTWFYIGAFVIIFGHFFVPFLTLLRIDVKLTTGIMVPLFLWAWLMHFVDMSFNITPVKWTEGFHLDWMDIACWIFIGGVLSKFFIKHLMAFPILPQKDPRFAESQDIYVPPADIPAVNQDMGGGH